MAADVRINEVDTALTATDVSDLLSQKAMDRIVNAVLVRVFEKLQIEGEAKRERNFGTPLRQGAGQGM
ncbi:MAG: hypothetical protein IIA92_04450 [Chloroflexi bacterium]|nr:hypothetical protein [Chloroflexota bacterium]